ncbi:MAG: PIN domain-containing protein [Bacteroidota bacterium]
MNDVLVDTNVLVYAFDQAAKDHVRSLNLLSNPNVNLFCATKNLSEYFAVCTKLKFPTANVLSFFSQIEQNTTFLYPSPASLQQFKFLFSKYLPTGNRVFDVEIVSVMLANGIKEIATVNTSDFQAITEIHLFPF